MKEKLTLGMQVYVPFGKRNIKGYVVELTDEPEFEVAKIKEIIGIATDSVPIESQLIALTRFQGEIGYYPEEYLEIIRLYMGK